MVHAQYRRKMTLEVEYYSPNDSFQLDWVQRVSDSSELDLLQRLVETAVAVNVKQISDA